MKIYFFTAGMRPDLSSRVYRRTQGDRRASSIGLGAEVRRAAGKTQQLGSSSGQGESSLNKAAPTYAVVRISGLGVRLQVNHTCMHPYAYIIHSYIYTSKIHCRYHIVVFYGDDLIQHVFFCTIILVCAINSGRDFHHLGGDRAEKSLRLLISLIPLYRPTIHHYLIMFQSVVIL